MFLQNTFYQFAKVVVVRPSHFLAVSLCDKDHYDPGVVDTPAHMINHVT